MWPSSNASTLLTSPNTHVLTLTLTRPGLNPNSLKPPNQPNPVVLRVLKGSVQLVLAIDLSTHQPSPYAYPATKQDRKIKTYSKDLRVDFENRQPTLLRSKSMGKGFLILQPTSYFSKDIQSTPL